MLLLVLLVCHTAFAQEQHEHYEKAVQAFAGEEYSEAFIHLKNALQVDPNMIEARLLLAKVHANTGNIAGAAKESEEALLLGADVNLVLPVYGSALVLQQRDEDLFALERVADEFTPENQFEWLLLKGQGYLMRDEPERAQRTFEQAAELFPFDVRANNTLAGAYLRSNMLDDARVVLDRSLRLDPDSVKTLELQAELAIAEGRYDAALESLARAEALEPEDLRVLRSAARVHLLTGNQPEIQNYLDKILAVSPGDPAATLLTAIVRISEGEAELGSEMLADLSQKLSEADAILHESSDNMLFIQASADYVRGSDQSAIALFNNYLLRRPGDLSAVRMLTDLYMRNGRLREANELLGRSREAVMADASLSLKLLHLYIQNGSILSAQEMLEEVRVRQAGNPFVTVMEAELARSRGRSQEALALLEANDTGGDLPVAYDLLRGALLLDLGREEEAEALALSLQEEKPDEVGVHNFAALCHLRQRELEQASAAIARAMELSRNDIEARFNQAMLLKMQGDLDASATGLNSVLQDRPDHTRSIMLMAQILYEQGEVDQAIDWSKRALVYDKSSTLPDRFQLRVYRAAGDLDKAILAAVQLTRADPLNASFHLQLAELYMEQGDMGVAQKPLRNLYTLWGDDPALLQRLAGMQVESGNLPEARLSLQRALELDPGSLSLALDMARLDLAAGDIPGARARAEALREQRGDSAELAVLQGDIALAAELPRDAHLHYLRAYALNPLNERAVISLYRLSIEGIGSEAFTDAVEANLGQYPISPMVVRMVADSYVSQGRPERAQRYYEILLTHPTLGADPAVLNNLANIYADTDLDKALATATRALEIEGDNNPALLDTLGWIHARRGEHEQALPYLRKAYALNARDPEIRYHIGATLLALGRNAEARTELRAALAADEDFSGIEDARRLLDQTLE